MVLVESGDKEFYLDGYLKSNLDSYHFMVHKKNTSIVLCWDGRSGMGKSTFAIQVAKYLDPNFDLDKIYFEPEEFINGLREAKKGDFILFDEALVFSNRSVMSSINKAIVQAMSMIRSKQIFVGFCSNSIFDLDRNLPLSRADMLLHVYGDSAIDRGNFCAFFKSKGGEDRLKLLYLIGKKFYSYSKPKANFYGRFYKKFLVDEEEYEKKKQIGIDHFLQISAKSLGKSAVFEHKLVKYLKEQVGLSHKEIAEVGEVTTRTIYNKLNIQEK